MRRLAELCCQKLICEFLLFVLTPVRIKSIKKNRLLKFRFSLYIKIEKCWKNKTRLFPIFYHFLTFFMPSSLKLLKHGIVWLSVTLYYLFCILCRPTYICLQHLLIWIWVTTKKRSILPLKARMR